MTSRNFRCSTLLFCFTLVEDEEAWHSKFEQFDILTVLEKGEKLLGSAGDEFEDDQTLSGKFEIY